MPKPTIEDGARALSIEPPEVSAVGEHPKGLLVETTDGAQYIVADQPDHEGRTGLMYFVPPVENYRGSFPVFAPAPEPAPESSPAPDEEPSATAPKARRR